MLALRRAARRVVRRYASIARGKSHRGPRIRQPAISRRAPELRPASRRMVHEPCQLQGPPQTARRQGLTLSAPASHRAAARLSQPAPASGEVGRPCDPTTRELRPPMRPHPSAPELFPPPHTLPGLLDRLLNLYLRVNAMQPAPEDCYLLSGQLARLSLTVDEMAAFHRRRAAFLPAATPPTTATIPPGASTAAAPPTQSTPTCAAPASVSRSVPLSMPPSIAKRTTRRRRRATIAP